MAFERVKIRIPTGDEYGPVTMPEVVQWRYEGRVPERSLIIDADSGEIRAMNSFPALTVPLPPMPGVGPAQPSFGNSGMERLIPTKNTNALVAYYLSVFGILCLPVLGPIALILGIKGLKESKIIGVGRTHALVGIIGGSIETLLGLSIIAMIIFSAIMESR